MTRRRSRAAAIEEGDLVGAMTEAQLQSYVEGQLRFYGWRHVHIPANVPRSTAGGKTVRARLTPGFPDLLAGRDLAEVGPELLIVELKAEAGRYGPGQLDWLTMFEAIAAGVHTDSRTAIGVYTWRPSDLEELELVLAGPRGVGIPVDKSA